MMGEIGGIAVRDKLVVAVGPLTNCATATSRWLLALRAEI